MGYAVHQTPRAKPLLTALKLHNCVRPHPSYVPSLTFTVRGRPEGRDASSRRGGNDSIGRLQTDAGCLQLRQSKPSSASPHPCGNGGVHAGQEFKDRH